MAPLAKQQDNVHTSLDEDEDDVVWDLLFDTTQEIGLLISGDTTRVIGAQPDTQACTLLGERLVQCNRNTYIVAVAGNATYNRAHVVAETERCRNSLSRSTVITFANQPARPVPLSRPLWNFVLLITKCIPPPGDDILTNSHNGKFLGLWSPTQSCSSLCCCIWACRAKFRLETAVCVLALLQLVAATLGFLVNLLMLGEFDDMEYQMAHQVIDAGLSLYALKGVQTHHAAPIAHFALMQFLFGVSSMIEGVVALVEWLVGQEGLYGGAFLDRWIDAAFKIYYSWVAWSLAEEYRLEHQKQQQRAQNVKDADRDDDANEDMLV
eukprot:scaffold9371_cov211-Amphora_coffeaeformis.AAC.5